MRRAVARIDLGAIERNVASLAGRLEPGTTMCAVVKADGYGHGMIEAAGAALRGGAQVLAVATAGEAMRLRDAFPDEPTFIMGAISEDEVTDALASGADLSIWRDASRELIAGRAAQANVVPRIHVKHDSGMGRLGLRDSEAVGALADAVVADERLELAGVWTHFATADDEDDAFMREQLDRFLRVAEAVRDRHPEVIAHAANSAATIRAPRAHLDMVRCGVAIYGLDPFGRDPADHELEPALELASYVADVKRFAPGSSAGYGRTWVAERETWVAPVPIGYGDGWRRGLSNRAEAIVGGRRRPVVGTVSMDNITVDLGPEHDVEAFDEVVLIGERNGERILAEDVARALGTINYEITCGISARVERHYGGAG